jgi:hypothetical protein
MNDAPSTYCDLAVALNPTQQTMQATWAALRPGGACYLEWTSPLTGGPARLRQHLETIGFTRVECYWPLPWPDTCSTLYWLPIESPHVVRYLLANRMQGQTRLSRVWSRVLEVVWRMGLNLRLLAPLSIVAQKPPAAETTVLDLVHAGWSRWSSGSPPQHLDWMLLTGGLKSINKVIGHLGESVPQRSLVPRVDGQLLRAM